MNRNEGSPDFGNLLGNRPQAWAKLTGSEHFPEIRGLVRFYQTAFGVLSVAEVIGLPKPDGVCESPIFAFHIHGGGACRGNASDPFAEAGVHFNPNGCPHPYHAGDLPPLFGANGYAFAANLTNRFSVKEILGKAVILHASPDDFVSQPAGNAGEKIACGIIRR